YPGPTPAPWERPPPLVACRVSTATQRRSPVAGPCVPLRPAGAHAADTSAIARGSDPPTAPLRNSGVWRPEQQEIATSQAIFPPARCRCQGETVGRHRSPRAAATPARAASLPRTPAGPPAATPGTAGRAARPPLAARRGGPDRPRAVPRVARSGGRA